MMVRRLLGFLKEEDDSGLAAGKDGWFPYYSEGDTQCASLQASDATYSCALHSTWHKVKHGQYPERTFPSGIFPKDPFDQVFGRS